jgi:putative integral membrane protein (TIGR02587 family)
MGGEHRRTVAESLREYGRGLAGGLIFSLPLLYTKEVWQTGFYASPERLILYLAFIFTLLLGYNHFAGIRKDVHRLEVVIDSVEEFGLGVLIASGVLFLMGRLGSNTSLVEAVGQIVIEGGMVAIGFSVGAAQLGEKNDEDDSASAEVEGNGNIGGQLMIATCGAVLFAANIAPTAEVMVIALESNAVRLLGIVALSMMVGGVVLFFAGFRGASSVSRDRTPIAISGGIVVTYATALMASAAMLWFFGRFDDADTYLCVAQTVVLALPAALGASAGRLLLHP